MAQDIVLIGNGITADILQSYVSLDDRYNIVACSIDAKYIDKEVQYGVPVIPITNLLKKFPPNEVKLIMAVGYRNLNKTRSDVFSQVNDMGYECEAYIHPKAMVFAEGRVGAGSVVLAGTVIEPHATVGLNSMIWANCTVAHHSNIGNHCWIASGSVVAGQATVKDRTFLGVNVTISNQVVVGQDNLIGGHAMIQKNTKDNEVYLARSGEIHRFAAKDYAQHLLR